MLSFFNRQEDTEITFAQLLNKPQKIQKNFQGLEILEDGLLVQWLDAGKKLQATQNGALWLLSTDRWDVSFYPQSQSPELLVNLTLELDLHDNLFLPQFLAQQKSSIALDELALLVKEIAGRFIIVPAMTEDEKRVQLSVISNALLSRIGLQCVAFDYQYCIDEQSNMAYQLLTQWQQQRQEKSVWHNDEVDFETDSKMQSSSSAPQAQPNAEDFEELSGLAVELGLSPKRYTQWWRPVALDTALREQISRNLDVHSLTLQQWRREHSKQLDDNVWHLCKNIEDQMRQTAQKLILLPPLSAKYWSYRKRRYTAGLIRSVKENEQQIVAQLQTLSSNKVPLHSITAIGNVLETLKETLEQRKLEVIYG